MFKRWIGKLAGSTRRAGRATVRLLERELSILAREVMLVRGLLPLVARPRNDGWSAHDKAQLRAHLWRIFRISCCMVLLVLPGSFVLLPLIAAGREWSRNRSPRAAGNAGPNAADA